MRNQALSSVYSHTHQSRSTAMMCLLLCITLNIQWLAATGGQTVSLVAGNNLTANGATIISDQGTALRAVSSPYVRNVHLFQKSSNFRVSSDLFDWFYLISNISPSHFA